MRHGVLYPTDGTPWSPGAQPSEAEIAPILLLEDDARINRIQEKAKVVEYTPGRFLQVNYVPKPDSVFVCFQMWDKNSIAYTLPALLRKEFAARPRLRRVNVVEGETRVGSIWDKEIRQRMSHATAFVADVEGGRPAVMVELGFAIGKRKRVFPVVRDQRSSQFPAWVRDMLSVGSYVADMPQIVSHIETDFRKRSPIQIEDRSPIAGWFRAPEWCKVAYGQANEALKYHSVTLKGPMIDESAFEGGQHGQSNCATAAILDASSVVLLVVVLDGTQADSLAHALMGVFHSRGTFGRGRARLDPCLVVLRKTKSVAVAEAAIKRHACLVEDPDEVLDHVSEWIDKKYKRYLSAIPGATPE
jgi:hypothetical protein